MRRVVATIGAALICFSTTGCVPAPVSDFFSGFTQTTSTQPKLGQSWVKVDEFGEGSAKVIIYQKCIGGFVASLALKPAYPETAPSFDFENNSRGCN